MKINEILTESAAWQRKEGKSKSGGLNKKGVASYRREHPGSKLQTAVTTEPSKLKKGSKASKRRKSFCARMKGMKKHRTSAKTARDPNSRINKSLRKWNCEGAENTENLLSESITFGPAVEKEFSDGSGKYWTGQDWERKVEEQCPYCNGTGKETYGDNSYVCDYCNGKGKVIETVSDAPELNVSNANGRVVLEMLGVEPESSGAIDNKDLPQIMRRLIMLKNKTGQEYTRPPSVTRSDRSTWSDDQGMTHIGRGPEMHDYGLSQQQLDKYVDRLIKLVQFAQKNNASLGWG